MRMAVKTRAWMRDDLEHLPDDGNRYEVLDGALFVTPQAKFDHQVIANGISVALTLYCRQFGLGAVVGPGAVVFGNNELQPDVQVVPGPPPQAGVEWKDLPVPLLVVEVLSDSTARRDVGKKREAYLLLNIPTYWVVDASARHVLVWTSERDEPVTMTDVLRWQPSDSHPPLEIPVESILPPTR